MLTIATVQVGNYLGRGEEYVAKLFDGIRRHMPKDVLWRGVCLTDDPLTLPYDVKPIEVPEGLSGWWNKVAMFKPGIFGRATRMLFFDLDTIITGDLSGLASYDGRFAGIRDFFHPPRLQSAVMAWEAGALNHIWNTWDEAGRPQFDPRGDQYWIEKMQPEADFFQDFLPSQLVSFKADCWPVGKIPDGARMVCFHGRPRPHECQAKFIKELWG